MFSLNLKHTMKYSTAKFKHLSKLSGPFTSFNLSESIIPPPELTPNVQAAYLEPLRRPAKYGILTCSLQMRSFEIRRLSFFADFSVRVAYYLGLCASGPVPLPKRIERWTVPRGPFAHAKSKENFERITHKRLITIKDGHPQVVDIWLAYLMKHAMSGVGMKAHIFRHETMEQEIKENVEELEKKC